MSTPIITVDGPEASGKGTLAKSIAAALNFYHLDTGAIYRSVAYNMMQYGLDPDDAETATKSAETLAAQFDVNLLLRPEIRTGEVGQNASKVARHAGVRMALLDIQRLAAKHPPKGFAGAVLDGRDAGTVVCPDADVKIFLTASAAERAQRRYKELQNRGQTVTYEAVLKALEERDLRDSTRDVAPLKPAEDAAVVDSGGMDADQVLETVLGLVRDRLAKKS
ncbi:MAG TPA: (d)CMP kinase [Alphaproteobacteria bacterium]